MKYRVQPSSFGWIIAGERVHYTGGNLRAAWEEAFLAFGLHGRLWQNILLVGMGASLIEIIAKTAASPAPAITVLEIDPDMVALQAQLYTLPLPYTVVLGDAAETLPTLPAQYDGIFVDAFVEESVPPQLLTAGFVRALWAHLKPQGLLLWNVLLSPQRKQVEQLLGKEFACLWKRRIAPHTFWAAAHRSEGLTLPF